MNPYTRRTAVVSLTAALAAGLTTSAAARSRSAGRGAAPAGPAPRDARQAYGPAVAPAPLERAHAHNDYAHRRPLLDALSHGFGSVEADIWLVEGRLLVGHEESDLDRDRTLESLYLDPLRMRVRANGGQVYAGHPLPLQLLIDIKNSGASAYRELARRLLPYREMLSVSDHGRVRTGAVTAVVSGDRAARPPLEAEQVRHAFYDGRLGDLGTPAPASLIPLVSGSWEESFTWRGHGPMPAGERAALRRIVAAAHAEHRRVRFWATPDRPGAAREAVWRELLAAGVDHLNTDDLAGLERFLRAAG
ncbi:phosphatidylinositol-specific phospholipase C/glycerophosphodiester phosphodiesterase family protein [Streptomyces sp. MST-110588]|uniref:phosphatidylinositol-specific phospholipase C/glycerophosphodiester phosphodiesterase family protein n=1 Tax=Streptomyces sp. MST-110588 TaxID=2833628 RepID=UPI001F5DE807|nr:phosphatidylinositol-specific phospholipase C/glycerophosphodiester phosphodiesterase family protein [Streptomyces sp. MST-110588]UNO43251.1 hypothetical protein KGS77_31870 [Streptomyces sp. MST-110588]